jgi:hypothetical protein
MTFQPTKGSIREMVAEIQKRSDAATPGPWRGIRKTGYIYASDCVTARCGDFRDKELVPFNGERWGNDAEFIAHARTDIPALLLIIDSLLDSAAEQETREVVRVPREEIETLVRTVSGYMHPSSVARREFDAIIRGWLARREGVST